jgi:predicted ATPase
MRQSPEHSRSTNQLILNGSCIELGNFDDIKNIETQGKQDIEFAFKFHQNNNYLDISYFFGENHEDNMGIDIERVGVSGKRAGEEFSLNVERENGSYFVHYQEAKFPTHWYNMLFDTPIKETQILDFIREMANLSRVHYISADRIGLQDFYPKHSFTDFRHVGNKGQHTANLLVSRRMDLVHEALCLSEGATKTVLDQTEAWLARIFDGGKIEVKSLKANIVLMEMNSKRGQTLYKPVNVGFGYSSALPIIVSGLIAQEGEILIVENPEAHLHPYAQSQLTKFLAQVSACGVQVFIESHSDHILNALRIAVLDEIIKSSELNILYFHRDDDGIQLSNVPVLDDGSIETWPSGFFDQIDKDFTRLFGV